MSIFALKFEAAKGRFFDPAKILRAVDRARMNVLKKQGALVRKLAQRSIRMSPDVSRPGSPPHGHKSGMRRRVSKRTGKVRERSVSLLREFIFFGYDRATDSVVVGPARLRGTVDPSSLAALEHGGPSTTQTGTRRRPRKVRINVRARPFMGPALEQARPQFAESWRHSVR